MTRPRVYIASPISRGNLAANVNAATAAFVALARLGFAPWCPHWSVYAKPCRPVWELGRNGRHFEADDLCECTGTRAGNDEMSHADWLALDLAWVAAADAVLRLPGESVGADMETAFARGRGIPVMGSVGEVAAYFGEAARG